MNSSYTEDITVAGVLLADRLQYFYEKTMTNSGAISEAEFARFPNLQFKVEKVQVLDRFGQSFWGKLIVTTTHLLFIYDEGSNETWVSYAHIASVERGSLSAGGCSLYIRTKTFLFLSFIIQRDKECQCLYDSLVQLSNPLSVEELYAFSYIPPMKSLEKSYGWDLINVKEDYQRLLGAENPKWVSTDFNSNFSQCDTYPEELYVPRSAPKQVLIGSCKFRSRGRLPVLSYYYPQNQAVICRCSQPLSGFSARCVEDEDMMQHVLKSNPNCNVLYVVDTRPRVNAMVNKAQGKGFEDEKNYANIRFHFQNVENIHVMRNSLQKLVEVCSQRSCTTSVFLSGLEGSSWLKHIRAILDAGAFIADAVFRGISCVVHCSDGWDRTPQTISIACILLDPHYRTFRGFLTLIERDWLNFGHKFSDRCGHLGQPTGEVSESAGMGGNAKEVSPVFTQFLECVWQIMQQFPQGFQFNEDFLLHIHDHVHSCQFGTFLGNCAKDREDLKLSSRTYSLWGYLWKQIDDYNNPLYQDKDIGKLIIDLRPQAIKLWRSMYNRFDNGIHPRENIFEIGAVVKEHIVLLEDHLSLLQQRVGELRTLLNKAPKSPTINSLMADSGHSSNCGHSADGTPHSDQNMKLQSDSESGVEDVSSLPLPRRPIPMLGQLASAGMSESLASLDLSMTDVCSSELSSVAVRWQSIRNAKTCTSCNSKFFQLEKKRHCYKCGLIFCNRCLDSHLPLQGLLSSTIVPVCKTCFKDLSHSQ